MESQQAPTPDASQERIAELEAKTADLERELARYQLEQQQSQSDRLRWEAEHLVVEAELRERQALFESVFNQVAIGLNYTDVNGHYLMVNQRYCEIVGYSEAELRTRTFQDITHPDDLEQDLQSLQPLLSGENSSFSMQKRVIHKDGHLVWINLSVSRVQEPGSGDHRLLSVVEDITYRKQAELENSQLRERLELLLSMTPAVIFTCKPDENYGTTFISSNVSQVLGYAPEEFLSDSRFWLDHVHPEDASAIAENLSALFVQGRHQYEYRFLHQDGNYRWVRDDLRLLWDNSGQLIEIVGYLADVSDRKTAEIALQQLNQELDRRVQERTAQLNLALSLSRMGIWEWDVQTNRQYWSPENFALFGLHPDNAGRVLDSQGRMISSELTNDVFFNLVHPEDREKVYQEVWRSLEEETFYGCEYRVVLPSGETRWHLTRTRLLFNPQGERIKEFGVTLDITRLKQTEIALRQSESLFRRLFENAPLGIAICSSEIGRMRQVNYLFCDMLGYTAAELAEMSFEDITHPEDLLREEVLVAQLVAGERTQYCIEKRFVKKTGEAFWAELTATALWDEMENVVYGLGMIRDISDRKRAEDQIRASLKEKEVMLKEIHHRVKNNLQIIVSLLRMQSSRVEDPEILMLFREAQNRVQSIALIHELLYQSADFAQINFRDYIQALVQTLSRTYRASFNQVSVNLKMTDLNLSLDAAIPCGLIINELVSNAFKHAFPGDRFGTIDIQLESSSGDPTSHQGIITVSDNGVGIPTDLNWEDSSSLGLVIVHSLVTQLRGVIECERTAGTRFRIAFPMDGELVS
jgi:PAS domain S-box-containing protein